MLTKVMVLKNAQEVNVSAKGMDHCEFDAKSGDRIIVKLKSMDTFTLTVASFVCQEGKDVYYVSPTVMCRRWELANYRILPYLCLLLIVLGVAIKSETYEWFSVGMIVLMALSLFSFQIGMLMPSVRKKLFKLDTL